jgi:hypothetical protein
MHGHAILSAHISFLLAHVTATFGEIHNAASPVLGTVLTRLLDAFCEGDRHIRYAPAFGVI